MKYASMYNKQTVHGNATTATFWYYFCPAKKLGNSLKNGIDLAVTVKFILIKPRRMGGNDISLRRIGI